MITSLITFFFYLAPDTHYRFLSNRLEIVAKGGSKSNGNFATSSDISKDATTVARLMDVETKETTTTKLQGNVRCMDRGYEREKEGVK